MKPTHGFAGTQFDTRYLPDQGWSVWKLDGTPTQVTRTHKSDAEAIRELSLSEPKAAQRLADAYAAMTASVELMSQYDL